MPHTKSDGKYAAFQFGPENIKSLKGLKWVLSNPNEILIEQFVKELGIDRLLAKILINRNVSNLQKAEEFLNAKIASTLPDPFSLKDMDKAVSRIMQTLESHEKVVLFADYDVDGATSSALLFRFLKALGIESEIYVPDRLNEGYGPNISAFKEMHDHGVTLAFTVDCGIVAFEALNYAKTIGIDVIVVDHHLSTDTLPEAVAVINPNRFDEVFPIKELAAVGVVFLLVVALRKTLKDSDWFRTHDVIEPNLMSLLDLVALGTICDVVPLVPLNRAFVTRGLKIISEKSNIGLATLAETVRINNQNISAHHLGFMLGPRINAGGRLASGKLGSALLITEDYAEAAEISQKLEAFNKERKIMESKALKEALLYIESTETHKHPAIVAVGEGWHIGILGILASRIKERFCKPALVISVSSNGICKGSGRSIQGLDIGRTLSQAKDLGLLLAGGGHHMAGGFSLYQENISLFQEYILEEFITMDREGIAEEMSRRILIDEQLSVDQINCQLLRSMNRAAPFGCGNTAPKFALCNVRVVKVEIRGEHLVVYIQKSQHHKTLKCMLFRGAKSKEGQTLISQNNDILSNSNSHTSIHLIGAVQPSIYSYQNPEMIIEDVGISNSL